MVYSIFTIEAIRTLIPKKCRQMRTTRTPDGFPPCLFPHFLGYFSFIHHSSKFCALSQFHQQAGKLIQSNCPTWVGTSSRSRKNQFPYRRNCSHYSTTHSRIWRSRLARMSHPSALSLLGWRAKGERSGWRRSRRNRLDSQRWGRSTLIGLGSDGRLERVFG